MSDNEVLYVRSAKKNMKPNEEDGSPNEEDPWDDSLLIEAYDKAVQIAHQGYLKKKQSADNVDSKVKKKITNPLKWKVGDKCRCQFSEDMKYYEADIMEITEANGTCVVRYVGYENEETVYLRKLLPSEGAAARSLQCQEALQTEDLDYESDVQSCSDKKPQMNTKKSYNKKKDSKNFKSENNFSSSNFPLPHSLNGIMPPPPPPPPPHMFKTITEDENETEAMSAMLISWYMSGYHTGYYHGLKMSQKK